MGYSRKPDPLFPSPQAKSSAVHECANNCALALWQAQKAEIRQWEVWNGACI